jgi:hypothetical protein
MTSSNIVEDDYLLNLQELVFNQPLLLEVIGNFLSLKDILNFRSVNKLTKEIISNKYIEKIFPKKEHYYVYNSYIRDFKKFIIENILQINYKSKVYIELNILDECLEWIYLEFYIIKLDNYNYMINKLSYKYDGEYSYIHCINNKESIIYNLNENKIDKNIELIDIDSREYNENFLTLSNIIDEIFINQPIIG